MAGLKTWCCLLRSGHHRIHTQRLFSRLFLRTISHAANRRYSSNMAPSIHSAQPSSVGFDDYEYERENFKLEAPTYFNFAVDVIDKWAAVEKTSNVRQGKPAFWWISDDGKSLQWNFQQLSDMSKRAANVLEGPCGLQRGDRVIVIMAKLPPWWIINLAAIRAGIVIIPGTTQLTSHDIRHRLERSGAQAIIVDPDAVDRVDEAIYDADCPLLRTKMVAGDAPGFSRTGWQNFEDLYNHVSPDYTGLLTKGDETMMIYFTSGTTGTAKMCEHTHNSYGLGHLLTGRFWLDTGPTQVLWNMSDPGWAKSAYSNLFGPWHMGACVFIHHSTAKFNPERTLQILEHYPIDSFCNAPTAYRMMVQDNLAKYNIKTLKHCMSAGEPLNPEVTQMWFNGTGRTVREGYGQTEMVLACATYRCVAVKPGAIGKPAPGMDLRVVDDDGIPLSTGQEGNIALKVKPHRPVGLFKQYLDDPERTAAAFNGDYYLLGDRGYMDDDGYVWFVSRSDDIIMSAGYRIGPFEVESALIQHPAVAESAVVGTPDEIRGAAVKAFVILTDAYKGADPEKLKVELQEFVKHETAPYKYPRKIEFVQSLPKTVSGKIRRVELRNKEYGS